MKSSAVISDSSCLIALRDAGRLEFLPLLFDKVLIPPAVSREAHLPPLDWLFVEAPENVALVMELRETLDAGESEAIALAVEKRLPLIIDERLGRREARQRKIPMTGLAGLLLEAKSLGKIEAVRPYLDSLINAGFRVGARLLQEILIQAGEDSSPT